DEGRYGFHHIHAEGRETQPRLLDEGEYKPIEWSRLPELLDLRLRQTGRLAAVLSPHLTVEDAYLLAKYLRSIDDNAVLALGPIPTDGEDERFKNGFTIRAEKCPNRRGVEKVVQHFMQGAVDFDNLLTKIEDGHIDGLWVAGGYKTNWVETETASRFDGLKLLIVQDLFASPLWDRADFHLPAAAFAEREGSFVNIDDRLQSFTWAVRAPAGATQEARLAWRLLNEAGMYNGRRALSQLAADIAYFSAASEIVPNTGIDLKTNLLAEAGA
ncbi:MAG: molybdopterin-dependent oxidoreductase, partial [Planctomycetales bacterium]|nr:molybdopterin-dependent oxidoreductase [Planctomycetales bacterium]